MNLREAVALNYGIDIRLIEDAEVDSEEISRLMGGGKIVIDVLNLKVRIPNLQEFIEEADNRALVKRAEERAS